MRTFAYNVAADCRLRHTHRRLKRRVVSFSVQLEVRHPRTGGWIAIVRYDTAHGVAHRDRLHANGTGEKMPLPIEDYNQALNYAETDLEEHWRVYHRQFLEELEHEKRR